MNKKTILIKVGGSILQDEKEIDLLCKDIKTLSDEGYKIIIVHGGGKAINEALAIWGIESEFINGLRVTSAAAMKVIEMVLCGQVNQLLVRKLNRFGLNALGLSGAENQMLVCDYHSQQHGYVGDIKAVNPVFIKELLNSFNTIPVIASIGSDKDGNALNINADMVASHLANSLGVEQLIYLTDQNGIYNAQGIIFPYLSQQHLEQLIESSIVEGGMLVKVKAILASLTVGLEQIQILNGKQKQILLNAVLHKKAVGTLCTI